MTARSHHSFARPKVLGLITARGGSKSIPQKNIALVAGKPLITWTIDAANLSTSIDRIIVSTDDVSIADVSFGSGGEVPFMRPNELAQDESSHIDVVIHAIDWLAANEQYRPDYVILLQPTSPLRTAEDIDEAIKLILDKSAKCVVSVCESHQHPYLMTRITQAGALAKFMLDSPESGSASIRRQEMPPAYFINGAIYIVSCKALLEERTLLPAPAFPYIMPQERSYQIDVPWDLYFVDLLMRTNIALEKDHKE